MLGQEKITFDDFRAFVESSKARMTKLVKTPRLPVEVAEATAILRKELRAVLTEFHAFLRQDDITPAEITLASAIVRGWGRLYFLFLGAMTVKVTIVPIEGAGIFDNIADALGVDRDVVKTVVFVGLGLVGLGLTASLVKSFRGVIRE